jgi:hypothetical protein
VAGRFGTGRAANVEEVTTEGSREHPMAAFKRIDTVRRRLDEDAFAPSPVIERLVLQVMR